MRTGYLYVTAKEARDIRNIDQLLSGKDRAALLADKHFQDELWMFFRAMRVRLDKAGDKHVAFQRVPGER